ncbi:MAG: hypothetical protein CL666_09190 [Balneola sp.]|nr:hypothetical protein [Balneola sp.]
MTFVLLFQLCGSFDVTAQEIPFVYQEEETCDDCQAPYMPSVNELPNVQALTNPFEWSDGRGVISNYSDWKHRRAEIGAEIEHYETGGVPQDPDAIEATYADGVLTVHVTVNDNTLTLTSPVTLPEGTGPFPAVIGMGGASGSLPGEIFSSRDIAQISFNFGQVMAHTQTRGSEPINDLYPERTDIGAYGAWPWGVSRLIDGLEMVSDDLNIDTDKLAVTGCSFAGKMALFAGAFDERIALTISQESGGGGYTSWRFSDTMDGVETLAATNAAWFREGFKGAFGNAATKLPFDHHELMAMVAPRALLVTGNDGWTWLADESGYVASNAAEKVWDALGVPDRFGYYNMGGHNHCALTAEKRVVIENYVDKFLVGVDSVDTDVAASPYNTDLTPWITWETPVLGNDSSYFGKTSLVAPANNEEDQDTTITLKWNGSDDAASYNIEVSPGASFQNVIHESSASDTSATIDGLEKGQKYFWRIQIENQEGETGPWTDPYNFTTYIPLPGAPLLGSVETYRNRLDFVNMEWRQAIYAREYRAELSADEAFGSMTDTYEGRDTSAVMNGVDEGKTYYWRVRAVNTTGNSEWSEVSTFVILAPPTALEITQNNDNEITLNWRDRTNAEDGYIIERKTSEEAGFVTIDTVETDVVEFVDSGTADESGIYRVKAYQGEFVSGYSNEASLTAVSNETDRLLPTEFALAQNFPNPFNPTTNIQFSIPEASDVQLNVYNMLGQKVENLINGRVVAGNHTVVFDAGNLSSGLYFYALQAGEFLQTRKLSLIK